MASSSARRDQDLAFLVVQFLDEHNFTETARMLEKEGKLYLNMKYVEEAVREGKWKELEDYILCFTKIEDNTFSLQLILEIRRQKYNEALDNLNWQHTMCKYPKLNPAVSTLYVDHTCGDAVVQSLDDGDFRASANLTPSNTDEREMPNIPDTNEQAQLYCLRLPDPILSQRIDRLTYTNSGDAIVARSCTGVYKFWKWGVANDNPTGKATIRVVPPVFSANFDISLGENVPFVPYFALSKNDGYVASVSESGKVSLFNCVASAFKIMDTNLSPPPAATSVMFYPEDNNIIIIGKEDGSILIYTVQKDMVIAQIHAHQTRVTGLAYSRALNILVSSAYDAQICAWSRFGWRRQSCKFLDVYGNAVSPGHISVMFHQDQINLLVVHDTCIATLQGPNLEPLNQWIPGQVIKDAAYSSDGQCIYACFLNRHVVVLDSESFEIKFAINPSAYLPSNPSSVVYPSALAANPAKQNQFALGLSDGGVLVLELEEGNNGIDPVARLSLRPATN
ncbi:hypothetical protein ACET3Z_026710 [Daucus carota]